MYPTQPRSPADNLLAYAADLELEVDRLRRRDQFWQQASHEWIKRIAAQCKTTDAQPSAAGPLAAIGEACHEFHKLLGDLSEPPGYHPAFDQVVAIAVRPLAEQIFREQQRLSNTPAAVLRFELESDYVLWFPARFRHILDNLVSNALRYRDPAKGEIRVGLALRTLPEGYELQISDNGLGIPPDQVEGMLELFYRAAPVRAAGLGVGLAVVKLLVEQCCGSVAVTSGDSQGTTVTVRLPRFDRNDYVDR
jgi:light-regulated signal transduction histidine kinase (bacteriophytochrome)